MSGSKHSTPTKFKGSSDNLIKEQFVEDFENAALQNHQRELELLMSELQNRDRELNAMVTAHQRQLSAWDQDRSRIKGLEEKLACRERELHQRNEEIYSLMARLKVLESDQIDKRNALDSTQEQLALVTERHNSTSYQLHELEERNHGLTVALKQVQNDKRNLEVKERDLRSALDSKDHDLSEVKSQLSDLKSQLSKSKSVQVELRSSEADLKKAVADLQSKCSMISLDSDHNKKESKKWEQLADEHKISIERLKQELYMSKKEAVLAYEREKRKDQLLELCRSKQDRTDLELTNIRELYERQQRDLAIFHVNLENSKYILGHQGQQNETERSSQHSRASMLNLSSAVSSPKAAKVPSSTGSPQQSKLTQPALSGMNSPAASAKRTQSGNSTPVSPATSRTSERRYQPQQGVASFEQLLENSDQLFEDQNRLPSTLQQQIEFNSETDFNKLFPTDDRSYRGFDEMPAAQNFYKGLDEMPARELDNGRVLKPLEITPPNCEDFMFAPSGGRSSRLSRGSSRTITQGGSANSSMDGELIINQIYSDDDDEANLLRIHSPIHSPSSFGHLSTRSAPPAFKIRDDSTAEMRPASVIWPKSSSCEQITRSLLTDQKIFLKDDMAEGVNSMFPATDTVGFRSSGNGDVANDNNTSRKSSTARSGESVPRHGESVPRHGGENVPGHDGSVPRHGENVPGHDGSVPRHGGENVPGQDESVPRHDESVPRHGESVPRQGENVPEYGGSVPRSGRSSSNVSLGSRKESSFTPQTSDGLRAINQSDIADRPVEDVTNP